MTVEAGNSCGVPPLANDLRRRTYAADIAQNGARLTVTLSGAPLAAAGGPRDRFSGIADLSGANVELRSIRDDYFSDLPDHPDVLEALADGTALVIAGRAALVQTPTGLSGKLTGAIPFRDRPFLRTRIEEIALRSTARHLQHHDTDVDTAMSNPPVPCRVRFERLPSFWKYEARMSGR